jgi:hypothetical protein
VIELRGVPAIVLVLLALGMAAAPRAHADQMFGMNVNRVLNDDFTPAHWDRPLTEVRADGIRVARSDAFWSWAEPLAPQNGVHHYTWGMLDQEATALAAHDLDWLPALGYSTAWSSSGPSEYNPPKNAGDYAAFAAAFAARYGRGGSFWAEHPALPAHPVTTFEIWNEPNVGFFWRPGPDAGRYANLYMAARTAIRRVDPGATVMVGGIVADTSFIRGMYTARPDLRGNVDGFGLHPYSPTVEGVLGHVVAMRRTLQALGDPHAPIFITELGWPTSGTGWLPAMPDARRADTLSRVADTLARSDCDIGSIVPYTWSTPEWDHNDVQDWLGIRHRNGRTTATSLAYAAVIARWTAQPVTSATRVQLCHPPDLDGDGIPDWKDGDMDGDDMPNGADAYPRDPGESVDTDLDGIGDNADPDDDDDGLSDKAERRLGTSSRDVDSDDDGIRDGDEKRTNPARADTDGDGLPDGLEAGVTKPVADPPGVVVGTDRARFRPDRDPRTRTLTRRRDTDRDGLPDRREDRNRNGRRDRGETDPRRRDTDRDRVPDGRDQRPLDRRRH